tara:strand:- start:2550 stop:2966 length:417 start_codon:yes stop_codon:yes gene_type:complete
MRSLFLKIIIFIAPLLILSLYSWGDCASIANGKIIEIQVKGCEAINGQTHPRVREKAGQFYDTWELKKMYTGALITDDNNGSWMYPTDKSNPCKNILKDKKIKKRAYYTCCDTGAWGKCVFGGNWLGDIGDKEINAFQ